MKPVQFHKNFKLQGKSFKTHQEVIDFSKEISYEVSDFLKQWFALSLDIEVTTSGSTGVPKTIRIQKEYMVNSAKATGKYFNLPENTSALLCMSPNFIAGKMMLVRALVLGWKLDVVTPTLNPLKKNKKQYDFVAMVPMQLSHSLNDLHAVKKLIVGGGSVSKELLKQIQQLKTHIFATYGMTETITHIAVKKLNNFGIHISGDGEKSSYKVLPDITISIDNRGCLIIKAPKIADEIIKTNDIVELISETEFKWLGRFDTIINSGGIKLIPEQIEEKFAEIINKRFFVAGIPDTVLGEKLVLIIESSKNSKIDNFEENKILELVKKTKTISKYEIPKEIYSVEQFIETPTNKVNRMETLKLIKRIY